MATQAKIIKIKRGDSFIFTNNQLLDTNNEPVDLTGWGVRSQIRDRSMSLVDELDVTISQFDYSIVKMNTESWPVVDLFWDVEYTAPDGTVFSSETITVKVIQDVTF